MANYDYKAIGMLGVYNGARTIRACIGMGLLNALIEYPSGAVPIDTYGTGIPVAATDAFPADFQCVAHDYSVGGSTRLVPAGPADWSAIHETTDLALEVIVEITDPAGTTASPSPVIKDLALALGGTVDETAGL